MKKPWFAPKRFGLGLRPASPAGWIAVGVFALCLTGVVAAADRFAAPAWLRIAAVLALTGAFLILAVAKSAKKPWRWRWGSGD